MNFCLNVQARCLDRDYLDNFDWMDGRFLDEECTDKFRHQTDSFHELTLLICPVVMN